MDTASPLGGGVLGGSETVTNVAVTDFAAFMLTTHEPDPEQAPLHRENVA
ncbi:MAG: hypothetical protein NPIRA02_14750 [Nitrospirales bacterium]|nr:MAG: hypothetical protein NPIRA02_14750 [Nitrospirales bacterium]